MKDTNTVESMTGHVKPVKRVAGLAMLIILSGYAAHLMNSPSNVGAQEKHLIFFGIALTLLLVVPIIALNIYFVSRHRASRTTADCSHSIKKEIGVWIVPVAVVAVVTVLGW